MPPTRAARWTTISGRWSSYIRATSACLVRLYSALEKVATFAPRDSTSRTTWRPRKPRPPVTVTRFPSQKGIAAASWFDISPDFTADVHGSTETGIARIGTTFAEPVHTPARPATGCDAPAREMTLLQRNVLYNVLGQGAVLLLGLVAVKFIYGRLGQDVFGIIIFTQVLTVLLIRTASLFYWAVGLIILIGIYLASPFLVHSWINLSSTDPQTAATMIRILGISAAVALPRVLYGSLFRGIQRMSLNNVIDVGASALQQLGIVVILLLGATNIAVAWWIAGGASVGTLTYAIVAGRLFGWKSLLPGYSPSVIQRNLRFS